VSSNKNKELRGNMSLNKKLNKNKELRGNMSLNKKNFFALTAVAVAVMQFGTMAYAAENATVDEEELEVITVTSSRRLQAIQDVPASVIAVDPSAVISAGIGSMADVIDYAPGFSIDRSNGQRGQGSITSRGVGQQGATAVTAVYLDDVPMTSNSGFADGGAIYFDGLLGDIERIELVKGPQGTLFGATAIAGAVRYISRTPELEEGRGSISADLSTIEDGGVNKQYQGFYSFPLIEDTLGLTLSGFSADEAGYVDQVDAATGDVILEDANDSENHGYSADLFYQATDDLTFRVKALKQETSYGLGSAVRLEDLGKDERYGELKSDAAFGDSKIEHSMISAGMSYDFSYATLDITTSKVEYESDIITDYTANFAPLIDMILGNDPGTTTPVPFVKHLESEKTATEIKLTSKDNKNVEWIVGLYNADESTNNQQILTAQPSDTLAFFGEFPSEYKEFAAFGSVTYYVTPDFDLTMGMRYSDTELALDFNQGGLFVGGESNEQLETADDTVQTYSFSTRYRPNKDMSLYANMASGYRPASSNLTLVDPLTGEPLSEPIVKQDSLWSYEIGAKGELSDGLINYDVALWYIDWEDFQTNVYFNGLGTLGNAEEGISAYGAEASFTVSPGNGFTITTSLAYANSTLNEDEPSLFGEKGDDVAGVPDWTFSSMARYDFALSSGAAAWVGGGLRYTGGSPSAFDDGNPVNNTHNVESDDILLVDLNAGVDWNDNITLNIYVNNLLNDYSYHNYSATGQPGTGTVDITGIPTTPRTIGAAIKYSF
jgi:outer membrane receptor protein involved in Fe transport